jgi:two-component system sensor kinase FixL
MLKKMFLDIADAAPVGVLAICEHGIIRFVNPALCNIFGYAEDELIGRPVETLLPEVTRSGHRTLRDGFFANPSSRGMGQGRNLFGQHAKGWQIAVEIGLGSIGQGTDALSVAFINDISHKRLAEERFTTIVSALPAGLIVVDQAGGIVITNPALDEMFGYPEGALLGRPVEVLLPAGPRAGHVMLRESYMRAPVKRTMGAGRDLLALHFAGHAFPVEVALTPIFHAEQCSTLAIITDISVRKKLENALLQANVNLEEFTYIASHDLRSPLRGIADLIEWIEEDLDPAAMNETVVKNIARVKQRIARTERMIEDLLIYARSNTQDPRTETTSPRQLVAEVIEFTQAPPGFVIEVDVPDFTFVTCKTPLLTGMRNLLENALKHHSGTRGRIKIAVREEGRFLVFSVDDDGAGVPETAREKIFKLFQRATDATDGNGVGLSVTRRMISSHGGQLILEKSSPLGGACFTIYWPRYEIKEMA